VEDVWGVRGGCAKGAWRVHGGCVEGACAVRGVRVGAGNDCSPRLSTGLATVRLQLSR
jgi:hypothetical protein